MFDVFQIRKICLHLTRIPLVCARPWFTFCGSNLSHKIAMKRHWTAVLIKLVVLLCRSFIGTATCPHSASQQICKSYLDRPQHSPLTPPPTARRSRSEKGPAPTRSAPRPLGGYGSAQTRQWLIVMLHLTLHRRAADVPTGA